MWSQEIKTDGEGPGSDWATAPKEWNEYFRVDNINSEPYLDNKLNIVVNIDFYKGR